MAHSQPLNDPAIMQLSVPPSLGQQNFQTHPVLGAMGGPQMNQFGGYGTMAGTMGGISTGVSGPTGIGMHGRDRSMSGGAASTSKPSELINLGGPPTAPSSVLASTVEPIGGVAVNDHGKKIFLNCSAACDICLLQYGAWDYAFLLVIMVEIAWLI